MADQNILQVKVVSPREDIFVGPATAVSSKNSVGDFDVLPRHANFITLIEDKPIYVRKTDGTTENFRFPLAIVHVTNNEVKIYTNIDQI